MSERRRLSRRHILYYSRVFDRITGVFLGYLGNMNEGGLMIISESPLEIGQKFLLRIDLPEGIYELPGLDLEAESVWCRVDIDPNFHNTGFQFTEVSDGMKEIICQIINDNGFRN